MNILIVTWKWTNTGGDWTYVKNLCRLYESKGHRVFSASMMGDYEEVGNEERLFLDKIDFKNSQNGNYFIEGYKLVKHIFFNYKNADLLENFISVNNISLVHLHNVRNTITLGFLKKINRQKVKVFWTLHDYNILCPDIHFVRDNVVCEKCKNQKFYYSLINRCKKGSLPASLIAMLSNYYDFYSKFYEYVDAFLAPSLFIYNKFIENGFSKNKLFLTNYCFEFDFNLTELDSKKWNTDRFILYVGRVEEIKGIFTLVKALERLESIKLKILGGGELFDRIKNYIEYKGFTNIELLGKVPPKSVYKYISESEFVVTPSEWYENYPFSIIESMLLKKPVIGSNIGGIPELIDHDYTGFLFEPGDHVGLSKLIERLWNSDSQVMGENAFNHVSSIVSYENHYKILKSVYFKFGLIL